MAPLGVAVPTANTRRGREGSLHVTFPGRAEYDQAAAERLGDRHRIPQNSGHPSSGMLPDIGLKV